MKKPGSTLLIVGGVLEIIGIVFSLILMAVCFNANNPQVIAQVKETLKQTYPSATDAELDQIIAQAVQYFVIVGYVLIAVCIFQLAGGVLCFVTAKVQINPLYVVLIVLSVLSANIFVLIGAIMGLTAKE